jgi:RNA-directed DNA polymerase
VLIRLNQIMRGWASFFKHALCKHTLSNLAHFAWWRVIRWLRTRHRWKWKDVRRAFTTPEGRWKPVTADGIELFNWKQCRSPGTGTAAARSPAPGSSTTPDAAETVESPVPGDGHAGFGERSGETGQKRSWYRAPDRLNRFRRTRLVALCCSLIVTGTGADASGTLSRDGRCVPPGCPESP